MASDDASDDVVLGLDTAAWAFAPADQTSPALAARAGALYDAALTGERVTELRIHGVSGSDGPTMLEHPTALQVAGDTITGFFRRWNPGGGGRPSVRWKLEAYSWGGLTEQPLASASWLVLAPFMMYNVAHFMLPPEPGASASPEPGASASPERGASASPEPEPPVSPQPARPVSPGPARATGQAPPPEGGERRVTPPPVGWRHRSAQAVLRLLALAATVQFITGVTTVTVSTVAWQAAGRPGALPAWMSWYTGLPPGWRVAIALLSVGVVVALMWVISVRTANRYEARRGITTTEIPGGWRLAEPGFWKGLLLVRRQRTIHAASALAAAALLVALPASHPVWPQRAALLVSAAVLLAAIGLLVSPLSDRHNVTVVGEPPEDARTGWWCWLLLAAGVVAILGSAAVSGWTDRSAYPQTGMFPRTSGFLLWLLITQLALLFVFGITVGVLAYRARGKDKDFRPYLGGNLATLIALLGFLLGGLLTAALNLGVAGLLGTAVPGRLLLQPAPGNSLYVPWPVYAFGGVAVGLLAGALIAGPILYVRYRRNWKRFNQPAPPAGPGDGARTDGPDDSGRNPLVAVDYGQEAAAAPKNSKKAAKAWAVGLLADDAAHAVAWLVGGGLVVLLGFEITALVHAVQDQHLSPTVGFLHDGASIISFVTVALAGWLVARLRSDYSNASERKTIGALWDVATFWPRAAHPFAPPCYGERAIPEVVDRVLLLMGSGGPALPGQRDLAREYRVTVECGPVLLTGYSQGSIIAPAVAAQLPLDVLKGPDFALLTLACPARRLYGKAFPAYFGQQYLEQLARLLSHGGKQRWRNVVRRSDYIGSWIFRPPRPDGTQEHLENHVDQLCWDPVVLAPDDQSPPPPTHRHSGWWPDPRADEIGAYLVGLLRGAPPAPPGQPPRTLRGCLFRAFTRRRSRRGE